MELKTRISTRRYRGLKLCLLCVVCGLSASGDGVQYGGRQRLCASAMDALREARIAGLPRTVSVADNCLQCHSRAEGRAAEVVKLHRTSTHGKSNLSCNDCHGGDPAQSDRAKAHAANFVARPDANGTLAMCGACHQTELAQFKSSRHFQTSKNQARLDCAECHGTHSVGNPPESFSYVQFCAGCHGLEYLPELPKEFQALLTVVDEVRDEFAVRAAKGRKTSDEWIKQRKELRRLTADLVHPTDRAGGGERIPQIVSRGEQLKRQIKNNQ